MMDSCIAKFSECTVQCPPGKIIEHDIIQRIKDSKRMDIFDLTQSKMSLSKLTIILLHQYTFSSNLTHDSYLELIPILDCLVEAVVPGQGRRGVG